MELIYAIAEYLDEPNEFVTINKVYDNVAWFSCRGLSYTCKTTRNGKFLKKNSIRRDF